MTAVRYPAKCDDAARVRDATFNLSKTVSTFGIADNSTKTALLIVTIIVTFTIICVYTYIDWFGQLRRALGRQRDSIARLHTSMYKYSMCVYLDWGED